MKLMTWIGFVIDLKSLSIEDIRTALFLAIMMRKEPGIKYMTSILAT